MRLHFSPRPNRAHEIAWREWGKDAFEQAKAEEKPILLAISGVWCHWCHVMDETSYSDPEIISLINREFIPIRVDTDQRPDVNARYNLGGWPTTALLTSDGQLLTGGTYIEPSTLKRLLRRVADAWRSDRDRLVSSARAYSRARKTGPEVGTHQKPAPKDGEDGSVDGSLDEATTITLSEAFEETLRAARESFDAIYGGFGSEAKFPMVDALELCLEGYVLTGDQRLADMVVKTVEAMSGGGMYDHVEGGFFRYSTTRDWSIPHYEKMLEDNAALLGVVANLYKVTGDPRLLCLSRDVVRYLDNSLFQPSLGAYSGTQDADERYYSLDLAGRRQLDPPYIDRNIYSAWNGRLAASLIDLWSITDEDKHLERAISICQLLASRLYQPGSGMLHYIDSHSGESRLPGILDDQVECASAFLECFAATGDRSWLKLTGDLVKTIVTDYTTASGALADVHSPADPVGYLAEPVTDLQQNAKAARLLLKASVSMDEPNLASAARRALLALRREAKSYGVFASIYGLASVDAIRPWAKVTVVGDFSNGGNGAYSSTRSMVIAVRRHLTPQAVSVPIDVERDRDLALESGYDPDNIPRAYTCSGQRCYEPISDPDAIVRLLRELVTGLHAPTSDKPNSNRSSPESNRQQNYEERGQQVTELDPSDPEDIHTYTHH